MQLMVDAAICKKLLGHLVAPSNHYEAIEQLFATAIFGKPEQHAGTHIPVYAEVVPVVDIAGHLCQVHPLDPKGGWRVPVTKDKLVMVNGQVSLSQTVALAGLVGYSGNHLVEVDKETVAASRSRLVGFDSTVAGELTFRTELDVPPGTAITEYSAAVAYEPYAKRPMELMPELPEDMPEGEREAFYADARPRLIIAEDQDA